MTTHVAPHERPTGTYSYVFDGTDKAVETTYRCEVAGCGFRHVDASKARCFRKAKEHRIAHCTALITGGVGQTTIFDELAACDG